MRKWLIIMTVLAVAGGGLLLQFYRWFDYTAYRLADSERLPAAMANGIKHAYAAAESYAVLRAVGIGPETAEALVLTLGTLNEYAESYFRDPPDSTAEAAKDMYNNYVGITVARWHELHPGGKRRLEMIVTLAHAGIVVAHPGDVKEGLAAKAVDGGPDIAQARRWFRTRRAAIAQDVRNAL